MTNQNTSNKRKLTGVVVSNVADKTITVEVKRTKMHSKYLKRFIVSKKYLVHDEKNEYQKGDEVEFVESKPFSKNKRWRVLNKVVNK